MKYLLDVALVIGLLWMSHLWNGERQIGLAQSDEVAKLEALSARLEKELATAKEGAEQVKAELETAREALERTGGELEGKIQELAAKTEEANGLKDVGVKLRARVAELEGYKAKAIVAEMPKPAK